MHCINDGWVCISSTLLLVDSHKCFQGTTYILDPVFNSNPVVDQSSMPAAAPSVLTFCCFLTTPADGHKCCEGPRRPASPIFHHPQQQHQQARRRPARCTRRLALWWQQAAAAGPGKNSSVWPPCKRGYDCSSCTASAAPKHRGGWVLSRRGCFRAAATLPGLCSSQQVGHSTGLEVCGGSCSGLLAPLGIQLSDDWTQQTYCVCG
jgi:hypothetical protein